MIGVILGTLLTWRFDDHRLGRASPSAWEMP